MCSTRIAIVASCLLFANAAHAQEASPAPSTGRHTGLRRYDKPLKTVRLNLETGEVSRGPVVTDRSVSTCTTFPNLDLASFLGVDTGSCACEWIDAGVKSGGKSGFVTGFVFAYCSAALDTLSGGVGGAAELFFREGYTTGGPGIGGPPNGTEVGRFSLTGLPANTAC